MRLDSKVRVEIERVGGRGANVRKRVNVSARGLEKRPRSSGGVKDYKEGCIKDFLKFGT